MYLPTFRNSGSNHQELTLTDLRDCVRKNYNNDLIISRPHYPNDTININQLALDVEACLNMVNQHSTLLNMWQGMMHPHSEVQVMQEKIDYLEEKIAQLTFLIGEN
jgi:hypothetical protein